MAIAIGKTVTRDLTASTQEELSRLISTAFSPDKEAFGFDGNGRKVFDASGGVDQISTVDIKWKESVAEVKQKFRLDLRTAYNALAFTGHGTLGKRETITVGSISGGNVRSRVQVGSTIVTFSPSGVYDGPGEIEVSSTSLATQVANLLLNNSSFSNLIESATVTGSSISIHYTAEALSVSTNVFVSATGLRESNTTQSRTVNREFTLTSEGATVKFQITANVALGDANAIPFTFKSVNKTISAGGSLNWVDIANNTVGLVQGGGRAAIDSRTGDGDHYDFTLASGYAVSSLKVKITVTRAGGTITDHEIVAAFTGDGTTTYVPSTTETYGTFHILVQDPSDNEVHNLSIITAENSAITDVATLVQDAVNSNVLYVDANGKTVYLSSVISVTTGAITRGTDADSAVTSEFKLTFSWAVRGPATISVNTDGMNEIASDFSTVVTGTAGEAETASTTGIGWTHVSTSSTLQPGGKTTHFATLVYTKPATT